MEKARLSKPLQGPIDGPTGFSGKKFPGFSSLPKEITILITDN